MKLAQNILAVCIKDRQIVRAGLSNGTVVNWANRWLSKGRNTN